MGRGEVPGADVGGRAPLTSPALILRLALLTALTALGLDMILPALPAVAAGLAVPADRVEVIVPVFVLGMVAGELVFGPVADAAGRKPVLLTGVALFLAGTAVAALAGSLPVLVAGRILQGFGVSGTKIGARAVIRDIASGAAMARILSIVLGLLVLTPMLAPWAGQAVAGAFGWRAVFWCMGGVALLAGAWTLVAQPETLRPEARRPVSPGRIAATAREILSHPVVFAHGLAAGLIFGAQLLYLSEAQGFFATLYGRGDSFPFWFAVLAAGLGVAALTNGALVERVGLAAMLKGALAGQTIAAGAMLALALVTGGVPPFALFIAGFGASFLFMGTLIANLNARAMEPLGAVAGTGASVIAAGSSLVAAVFAMGLGQFDGFGIVPVAAGFVIAPVAALALIRTLGERIAAPVSETGP